MCKNSIWDLINNNINERDVQTGLYWECKHSSNTDDENMNVFFFLLAYLSWRHVRFSAAVQKQKGNAAGERHRKS